jgi:hypothetical protein
MCRFVEHRAQQGIATFGHPAFIVGLAGLVALRRQADMRADRPGMDETLWLVERTRTRAHASILCAPSCSLDQMFAELQAATARAMPEIGVLVAIAAKYGVAIEPPPD